MGFQCERTESPVAVPRILCCHPLSHSHPYPKANGEVALRGVMLSELQCSYCLAEGKTQVSSSALGICAVNYLLS